MALTTFVNDWGSTYNKANVVFSKDINTSNKSDKNVGSQLKLMLEDANKPSGVLATLAAIDKIDLASGSAKDLAALPGQIKLFKATLAKLESETKKYVKVIDDTLKVKITMKDKNGYNLPAPLKDAFPDTYRQLKVMQTDVQAIYARASNALEAAVNTEKRDKIEAEKNKAKAKVPDGEAGNAALKQISEEAAMKNLLLAFAPGFKSSMAKGAVVIQKIKASPEVATYNEHMNNGGRDISQNLVNLGKLKANPKFKGTALAKKLVDPGQMAKDILPFANGDLRHLPLTATPKEVVTALASFTALYKRIAVAYADVISGKVK